MTARGDYLTVPDSPDWAFSGDFTIEFFVNSSAPWSGDMGFVSQGTDGYSYFRILVNAGRWFWEVFDSNVDLLGLSGLNASFDPAVMNLNKWYQYDLRSPWPHLDHLLQRPATLDPRPPPLPIRTIPGP